MFFIYNFLKVLIIKKYISKLNNNFTLNKAKKTPTFL